MPNIGAEQILAALERHPRIAYQQILTRHDELARLQATLPTLVPFGDATYAGVIALLDWDHRMPTVAPVLRIGAHYSDESLAAGQARLAKRTAEIKHHDAFPEFDVGDYSDLLAEELYEVIVERSGKVVQVRLTSAWRRTVRPEIASAAVTLVRQSPLFRAVAPQTASVRPAHLGDLEAVAWVAPCEARHPRWAIDVWYMLELERARGRGQSFLVDLADGTIIATREFVVRPDHR